MHGFASNVLSCEERESQVVLPAAASAPSGTGGAGCARSAGTARGPWRGARLRAVILIARQRKPPGLIPEAGAGSGGGDQDEQTQAWKQRVAGRKAPFLGNKA